MLIHVGNEDAQTDHILHILDQIFPNDPSNEFFEELLIPDSNDEEEEEEDDLNNIVPDEGGGGASLVLDPISGLIDILPHHLNLNDDSDHDDDDDDDDEDEENGHLVPPWMNPAIISAFFGTSEASPHHFMPYPPTAMLSNHLETPQIWEVSLDEGEAPAGESEPNQVVQGGGGGEGEGEWETSSEEEIVGGDEENLGKECLLPEEEATKQLEDVAPAN